MLCKSDHVSPVLMQCLDSLYPYLQELLVEISLNSASSLSLHVTSPISLDFPRRTHFFVFRHTRRRWPKGAYSQSFLRTPFGYAKSSSQISSLNCESVYCAKIMTRSKIFLHPIRSPIAPPNNSCVALFNNAFSRRQWDASSLWNLCFSTANYKIDVIETF